MLSKTSYDCFKDKYVRIHTNAATNPVYHGKLREVTEEYLDLDPGVNTDAFQDILLKQVSHLNFFSKLFVSNQRLTETLGASEKPSFGEKFGTKVRIPLENIVAVAEVK